MVVTLQQVSSVTEDFFLLPPSRLPSLLASPQVNTGMQEEITGIDFTEDSFPEPGVTK